MGVVLGVVLVYVALSQCHGNYPEKMDMYNVHQSSSSASVVTDLTVVNIL